MAVQLAEKKDTLRIPYLITRLSTIFFIVLMFFPELSPTRIILQSGQAKISATASLFTGAISYSSLTNGLARAFDRGWLSEGFFVLLFIMCILVLIGVVALAAGCCASLGNEPLQYLGSRALLGGACAELVGTIGLLVSYFLITGSADESKITYQFPMSIAVFLVLAVVTFVLSVVIFRKTEKVPVKGEKLEIAPKYSLFLLLLPFLALVFVFSYLPLYSWRYAFYDYSAGGTLSADTFVGFKWFQVLIQNPAYVSRLLNVLKNTLAMSGLGIATSWLPMVFAMFLMEARSQRFKRFVQTFTTIPNFISWVLVYAIAFAIFNTDGFINTLINSMGGSANVNYLGLEDHSWLKMLAWGMWKGTGWSAIIYISGIAGIDQQLYEAATVDGAGRFQRMWHITLPGLLPTYVVMLVMSIAGILSNGMDQYLVFTNANNKDFLEVLDLYVYNLGIGNGSIPLSTVVGMAKSIISVVLLFIANTASRLIRGSNVV